MLGEDIHKIYYHMNILTNYVATHIHFLHCHYIKLFCNIVDNVYFIKTKPQTSKQNGYSITITGFIYSHKTIQQYHMVTIIESNAVTLFY